MNDAEVISQTIEEYAKLQRIMKAADPKKEIAIQQRILEAKLQAFGVVTEKLDWD